MLSYLLNWLGIATVEEVDAATLLIRVQLGQHASPELSQ